jgi:hypothetical protein
MGALRAGYMTRAVFTMAAVLLIYASPAVAAPPVCGPLPPQTVVVGADPLVIEPGSVCSDADGDVLSYAITTDAQHGTAQVAGDLLAYLPEIPYTGPDSFAFTASDGTTATAPVTVDITVLENQPPQCAATIALRVEPDVATSFDPWYECEDDQFFFLFDVDVPPQHGTLSPYDFDAGFTYEPTAGYRGPDSFVIRANDRVNQSEPITVDVTVLQPNGAPHCVTPVTVRVPVGGAVPLDWRTACSDPDGDPLSPQLITGPAHGALEAALPSITYRPAAGYRGSDLVRYRVTDDRGGASNIGTVNLIVGIAPPASTTDVAAPVLGIERAGPVKLRSVRRKGLRLLITANEQGTIQVAATVSKAVARKLRIKPKAKGRVVIGRMKQAVTAGDNIITVKLTRKARRALARARSVKVLITVRATDLAGNRDTETLRLTLKR